MESLENKNWWGIIAYNFLSNKNTAGTGSIFIGQIKCRRSRRRRG